MSAIGVAGRAAFFMLPEFKPVWALTIIAGVAFGGETGFVVGAMTMLSSNVLFGQGLWTPWQMFAMGMVGLFAGVLVRTERRKKLPLCIYGAISCIVIYGGIMDPASAIVYLHELSWEAVLPYFTGTSYEVPVLIGRSRQFGYNSKRRKYASEPPLTVKGVHFYFLGGSPIILGGADALLGGAL